MARKINTDHNFYPFENAWTMNVAKDNQAFFEPAWVLNKNEYLRNEHLSLHHYQDQVKHWEQLYKTLESTKNSVGTIGSLYQFSAYKETMLQHDSWLAQTHIAESK